METVSWVCIHSIVTSTLVGLDRILGRWINSSLTDLHAFVVAKLLPWCTYITILIRASSSPRLNLPSTDADLLRSALMSNDKRNNDFNTQTSAKSEDVDNKKRDQKQKAKIVQAC